MCGHDIGGMVRAFYIFSLYTCYINLILSLDFLNNRHVSSLSIQHLNIVLRIFLQID
jgi:hypothetical protein